MVSEMMPRAEVSWKSYFDNDINNDDDNNNTCSND